jgi:hypothetical protein
MIMNPMGVGNPLAVISGLSGLAGLSGVLSDVAKAPITRWSQSSMLHKLAAAGAGAGLAYYLHKRGMTDSAVAVAGVGGAYVASMLMHYPTVARQVAAGVPANGQAMQGFPPQQLAAMNRVAQNMFARGVPTMAPMPAGQMPATPAGQAPIPMQGMGASGGKWDLLNAEL